MKDSTFKVADTNSMRGFSVRRSAGPFVTHEPKIVETRISMNVYVAAGLDGELWGEQLYQLYHSIFFVNSRAYKGWL